MPLRHAGSSSTEAAIVTCLDIDIYVLGSLGARIGVTCVCVYVYEGAWVSGRDEA